MERNLQFPFSNQILQVLSIKKEGRIISTDHVDNCDKLEIEIGPMEIPQYPVFPVKKNETVTIIVPEMGLPLVVCRDDFPIVPHLNVRENGRKDLCLYDISYEDLEYQFNAFSLISRIRYWFEKTARNELHLPKQFLEPFFPFVNDSIILKGLPDECIAVKLENISHSKEFQMLREVSIDSQDIGDSCVLFRFKSSKSYSQNIINKIPKTLPELNNCFEDDLISQIDALITQVWAVRTHETLYRELFQQSENKLKRSRLFIIVDVGLARKEGGPIEEHTYRIFECSVNYFSLCSMFGYVTTNRKLVKKNPIGNLSQIKLHPFNYISAANRSLLQASNGTISPHKNDNYLQIGLGTLGSQFASNCFHEGYGKWTYIDEDVYFPHNVARHLLPQSLVGHYKTTAMVQYFQSLVEDDVRHYINNTFSNSIFSKDIENDIKECVDSSRLVIDTSASIAVERLLCNHLANKTRCVSFFMNPKGNALVMLMESADRSVRLDTLEMQYYRMLTKISELSAHLELEEKYEYTNSCRNQSMIIDQANVAIFAGLATKAFKKASIEDKGLVSIWTENDAIIQYYGERGEEFKTEVFDNWTVKISSQLEEELFRIRKSKLPNETGGVLVGSIDFKERILYIVNQIDAPGDSNEYPNAFIRGKSGLLEKINQIQNATRGNLEYVGEWHSHPNNNTNPSALDLVLLKSIGDYCINYGAPGCMTIVGDDHIRVVLDDIRCTQH